MFFTLSATVAECGILFQLKIIKIARTLTVSMPSRGTVVSVITQITTPPALTAADLRRLSTNRLPLQSLPFGSHC